MTRKIEKSEGGVELIGRVPSTNNPEATFQFASRYDGKEVSIQIIRGGRYETFKVKKVDFLRALTCIFPDAIHPHALREMEMSQMARPPQHGHGPNIRTIGPIMLPPPFNELFGGLGLGQPEFEPDDED